MRRLVIVVLVILALLVVGDFGFKAYAEGRFAGQVQQGIGLEEKPDLDLGGFPFALAMARGRLPSANVQADGIITGGLRVQHAEIDLRTVTFKAREILAGTKGTIHADTGSGEATVTEEDLTAYVNMQGYAGRIAFGEAVATVDTQILGANVQATGPMRIKDNRLVFEPTQAKAGNISFPVDRVGFTFDLPRPFEGFSYTGIEVAEGEATLKIQVNDAVIDIAAQAEASE
ncbi:MAG: DUF2993 domain-containing protein [Actinobacteria bacterium]|nr:DUF2993 domain-containing protein [Actinomycetota bacterium]